MKLKLLKKWNGQDGWYEITPVEAAEILERQARNRPLREHKSQRIAGEITSGRWKANGESIVFDDKDRLIDGQHRLRACVLSGRSIVVYCVFGVSGKVFQSIDQGDKRGGGDHAALMNFSNAASVASVSRLAIQYADHTIDKTGPAAVVSPDRLTAYMERNRARLESSVAFAYKHRAGLVKLIPISQAAFVHYMVSPSHNGKASEFMEKLASGAGLKRGDGLLLFRSRMTDLIGEKHKLKQYEKLALLIKAWNAHVAGKTVGTLRWRSEVETFPQFGQEE